TSLTWRPNPRDPVWTTQAAPQLTGASVPILFGVICSLVEISLAAYCPTTLVMSLIAPATKRSFGTLLISTIVASILLPAVMSLTATTAFPDPVTLLLVRVLLPLLLTATTKRTAAANPASAAMISRPRLPLGSDSPCILAIV